MPARLLPVAALAALALVPATTTALADEPGQGACSALSISGRPTEHAFELPGGERAVLRDPYGGLIFRNRRFVSFVVQTAKRGDRARLIDHVEWLYDGDARTLRNNRGGAYALQLPSTRFTAGSHKLTAHVVLKGGSTVDKTIPISATDCQPVTFFADLEVNKGRRARTLLRVGSGGPDLRSVSFIALRSLRATAPAAARGRAVGTLSFVDGTFPYRAAPPKALTLHLPRRPGRTAVLLRRGKLRVTLRPRARRMLDVTGLPAQTTGIELRLARGVIAPPRGCPVQSRIAATVVAVRGGTAAVRGGSSC